MGININIKKQYKVNGKTYNSLEELPEDIRQALTSGASGITFSRHFNAEAKITFNGREYDTPDAMDPDVRERYEKIMRAAAGGQTQELAEAVQEDQVKPQEIIPTVPYTTDYPYSSLHYPSDYQPCFRFSRMADSSYDCACGHGIFFLVSRQINPGKSVMPA